MRRDSISSLRGAFTLIELLVVVAIMAILLALLVPTLNIVRSKADNGACLSNLRQIGIGFTAYVGDHDGMLPGPAWSTVGPLYYAGNNNDIMYLLAPYVGISSTTPGGAVIKLFECPARLKVKPSLQPPPNMGPFYLANQGFNTNGMYIQPFGYPSTPTPSVKIVMIPHPSETWAFVDADQAGAPGAAGGWWYPFIPATPVHGNHRNAIFFDGHVQGLDTNWNPL